MKGEKQNMNKFITKLAKLFLGISMAAGVGVAINGNSKSTSALAAAEYDTPTTIASADVVSNSGYQTYETTDDIITYGGNNASVGTSSKKRSGCTLSSYSKYAVSPVTTSSIASAFVRKTSMSDIGKISYTVGGGSGHTDTSVYVIYSSDNVTFSQLSLTSGTQGADMSSGTTYVFDKRSGYFGLLFVATNTSGNWRLDNVSISYFPEKVAAKTLSSIQVTDISGKTWHAGDVVSATDLQIYTTYSDNSHETITDGTGVTITSGATLSQGSNTVSISYTDSYGTATGSVSITAAEAISLSSIAVTTAPSKTTYDEGDTFSKTGMVVTATYSDNSTADVTSSCVFTPNETTPLTTSNVSISISYTYKGVERTTSQAITVNEKHGTSTNPYSVAEAIADIDEGSGTGSTGAYATGIVSNIATAYSSQYNNVSFDIVDEIGDSVFLRAFRCAGTTAHPINSEDSVKVGDIVVVKGNLIYYSQSSIYEFSAGCTLEDITPNTISSLTVSDVSGKSWFAGDVVKTTDLQVVVNYSNGTHDTVTNGTGVTITSGATLSQGSNTVSISYTNAYGTQTGSVSISASAVVVLDSVTISGTAYADKNDLSSAWDLSGLTVTGTSEGGSDGDMGDITEHCVLSSSASTTTPGNTTITVRVNYKSGTKVIDVTGVAAVIRNIEKYTDTIDRTLTGRPNSTSYGEWSGKQDASEAIYAGNSAGGNDSVQLRSTDSAGIVSTASGGDLRSVTINFNSNTSSTRTVSVYGSTTAYSSAADLHDSSKQGTLIGEVNIDNGASQTITVNSDDSYQYVGIRSKSGAMYINSIDILWVHEEEVKTLESLSVTTNPTKMSYAAGQTLSLTGLVVTAHYEEQDVDDAPTVAFTTSPAEGYTFTSADGEAGSKLITIVSNDNAEITTSFTVTVTPKIPTALNRTAAASWTDSQTLGQGAGRWKAVFSDSTEQTNIKIGDPNTVLKIGGVTVDTSSLAKNYAGQEATLEFTSQNTTVSNIFTVSVADELSVDSFEDVPDYVLVTESSDLITANFTSLNGEPDSYSVTSSNGSKLSVSFDSSLVEYNSSTKKGLLYFSVTAGSTQGQYNVTVSVTLGQRTESKSVAIIVRGEAPTPAGVQYERITSLDDLTNGNYVIAANVGGTYKALPSISSGKIDPEIVSVTNDVISEENAGLLPVTITKDNEGKIAINKSTSYLVIKSSGTDFDVSSSATYYTVTAGNTGGTFRIVNGTRGLIYREGTTVKWGNYSTGNTFGTEYFGVELFKEVSSAAVKTSFDWVMEFVDGYMYMGSISITDLGSGACKGENGYYLTAKRAWNTMVTSYTTAGGEDNLVTVFESSFPDAYARYMAWASACGDSAPFTGTTIQSAPNALFITKNTNTIAIIVIISMVSVTAIGGYFFLRRRKENI